MLVTVLALTTGLVGFNGPRRPLRESARLAGVLLAQSVPVMVLPVLPLPARPGPDVGHADRRVRRHHRPLRLDDAGQHQPAVAIRRGRVPRAVSRTAPPERRRLYWRGPVFWQFDGRTWRAGDVPRVRATRSSTRSPRRSTTRSPSSRTSGNGCSRSRWRARVPPGAGATGDFQLLSRRPVTHAAPLRDELVPAVPGDGRLDAGASSPRRCELPAGLQPARGRARAELAARARHRRARPARARSTGSGAPGSSTRSPRRRSGATRSTSSCSSTKSGFCEHFASAFVLMMRAAGVPARVVTGYQGGEINPMDGYMIVRQSDAHAWAEVWIARRGLGAGRPDRGGGPDARRVGARGGGAGRRSAAVPRAGGPVLAAGAALQLGGARELLEPVGGRLQRRPPARAPVAARHAVAVVGEDGDDALLAGRARRRRASRSGCCAARASRTRWRARGGASAASSRAAAPSGARAEGPRAFAARAASEQPHVAADVAEISDLYVSLRYGAAPDPPSLALLRRRVREFKRVMDRAPRRQPIGALCKPSQFRHLGVARRSRRAPAVRRADLRRSRRGPRVRRRDGRAARFPPGRARARARRRALPRLGHNADDAAAARRAVVADLSRELPQSRDASRLARSSGAATPRRSIARRPSTACRPRSSSRSSASRPSTAATPAASACSTRSPRSRSTIRGGPSTSARELEQFLLLAREARADAASFRGSYAGAIGIPQFMPGSIRRYARGFRRRRPARPPRERGRRDRERRQFPRPARLARRRGGRGRRRRWRASAIACSSTAASSRTTAPCELREADVVFDEAIDDGHAERA